MEQKSKFSADWFDHNIENWKSWLGDFYGKPGLRFLEIGSYEGRSTIWLLQNILTDTTSTIDCADLFTTLPDLGDYYPRFMANTAPWKDRVTAHRGPSFDTLCRLQSEFDMVYVDGWHTAYGTMADAVMSWPRLKVGGVMIFDDYMWVPPAQLGERKRPGFVTRKMLQWKGINWRDAAFDADIAKDPAECPKPGIDGFLDALVGHCELLGRGYQLAIRKTRNF